MRPDHDRLTHHAVGRIRIPPVRGDISKYVQKFSRVAPLFQTSSNVGPETVYRPQSGLETAPEGHSSKRLSTVPISRYHSCRLSRKGVKAHSPPVIVALSRARHQSGRHKRRTDNRYRCRHRHSAQARRCSCVEAPCILVLHRMRPAVK